MKRKNTDLYFWGGLIVGAIIGAITTVMYIKQFGL